MRSADLTHLAAVLRAGGLVDSGADDRGLYVESNSVVVGQVALRAGVALTELKAAGGAGLEELFLTLTAETQREDAAA